MENGSQNICKKEKAGMEMFKESVIPAFLLFRRH